MKNTYRGSSFDRFLDKEVLRIKTEAVAIKRVKAYIAELKMTGQRRPATDRSRK